MSDDEKKQKVDLSKLPKDVQANLAKWAAKEAAKSGKMAEEHLSELAERGPIAVRQAALEVGKLARPGLADVL